MVDPIVRTSGLSKVYGETDSGTVALDDVTFSIFPGEFVVLLGPSGSGKTTLLNQIGALEGATAGSLIVSGVELSGMTEAQRTEYRRTTVGFVFQFYNLVPTLTAHENVALIAEITGGEADRRTDHILSRVGLADKGDHFPAEMSGGEQQRVAIARGIVKDPALLLCDEPTGALDLETGQHILDLLRSTTADTDRTVLLVTHNSTIARMADRIIRLRDGKVVGDEHNERPLDPSELVW